MVWIGGGCAFCVCGPSTRHRNRFSGGSQTWLLLLCRAYIIKNKIQRKEYRSRLFLVRPLSKKKKKRKKIIIISRNKSIGLKISFNDRCGDGRNKNTERPFMYILPCSLFFIFSNNIIIFYDLLKKSRTPNNDTR